jgi:hypothetical protein
VWVYFNRYLIRRATYAARFHFQNRRDISNRLFKYLNRITLGPFFDQLQRIVYNPDRGAFLAAMHHAVDKHSHMHVVVLHVRFHSALGCFKPS